jgi:hypothetical protein
MHQEPETNNPLTSAIDEEEKRGNEKTKGKRKEPEKKREDKGTKTNV